jgi:hypothetical protein
MEFDTESSLCNVLTMCVLYPYVCSTDYFLRLNLNPVSNGLSMRVKVSSPDVCRQTAVEVNVERIENVL